eukprot:comp11419_c0_seq1/m.5814 comp11419_c0_seq1/g.5814  ORF comp11419_c0_seq1/g.5814 comp11419_c0_seq1/m.5814 type:complete len:162 (-) comp11419_c0_seq1:294-779(-)
MAPVITGSEVERAKEVFGIFAAQKKASDLANQRRADGPPTILTATVPTAFRALGKNPTEKEVAELLQVVAPNGETEVTFEGFARALDFPVSMPSKVDEVLKGNRRLLTESGGKVSTTQLRVLLTQVGEKMGEDDVAKILAMLQPDSEGCVKYEDVLRMLMA